MRHWAYTLDAARSIVRSKANEMNNEMKWVMAVIVLGIVVTAIMDLLKLSREPKEQTQAHAVNLAQLPAGSIIVLPKGTE